MKRRDKWMVPHGWAQVAVAPNQIVAGMIEAALKEQGIPVLEKKVSFDYVAGIAGMRGIYVEPERLEEARVVVEQVWPCEEPNDE